MSATSPSDTCSLIPRSATRSSSFSRSGVLARSAFHCSRPKVTYRLIAAGKWVCIWSNWPQWCIPILPGSSFRRRLLNAFRLPENDNMLPGQGIDHFVEVIAFRSNLGAHFVHAHLVLGANRNARVLLAKF